VTDQDNAEECGPTAEGIVHCLRMLATEAASLNLARTLAAIEEAMQTCQVEHGTGFGDFLLGLTSGPVLH